MAAGGAFGGIARSALERWLPPGDGWPWATFAVNVAGCALLAWFATRLLERLPPATYRRPFLGTGLCGALTTFSTFQIEVLRLVHRGHAALGVGYLAASLAAGFGVVVLVTGLVRWGRLA